MSTTQHKNLAAAEAHVPGYKQSSDPGAVGAGMEWIDTSAGPPYQLKVRNAGNSAWEAVGGTGSGSVTGVTASSPLASSGGATPNITVANAAANTLMAGPTSGGTGAVGMRAMVAADVATHAHSSHSGIGANDHHNKSHAHNGADGSGTVAYSDLTGRPAIGITVLFKDTNFNMDPADGEHPVYLVDCTVNNLNIDCQLDSMSAALNQRFTVIVLNTAASTYSVNIVTAGGGSELIQTTAGPVGVINADLAGDVMEILGVAGPYNGTIYGWWLLPSIKRGSIYTG